MYYQLYLATIVAISSFAAAQGPGWVYFINQCPHVVYVTTNQTAANKPRFALGGTYTHGQGQYSYEFKLLDPNGGFGPGPQTTTSDDAAAVTNWFVEPPKPSPTGYPSTSTNPFNVDISISLKPNGSTDPAQDGHILYSAFNGSYTYQMKAPAGFLSEGTSQIDPAGPDCGITNGWNKPATNCSWISDMWIMLCQDYVGPRRRR